MSALGAALGLLGDRAFGEPDVDPHPVALLGRALAGVEKVLYADDRQAGTAHAGAGVLIGATAGRLVRSSAVATWIATSGRMLTETATEIGDALAGGSLEEARRLLPSLVGRDPRGLEEAEIARAVIESVAENTVDAVVAPAFWGAVAGAPGALGYRAVNTLDSMVGHRSERYENFGWASARLDDAANLIPARLTAALVVAVRPGRARQVLHAVRHEAPGHPSPNAGVAEAAFAAALGIRLGGTNDYGGRVEDRVGMGPGSPPVPSDIAAAVDLSREVTTALVVALVGVHLARGRRR